MTDLSELEYERFVVAFIDILGFRELIKTSTSRQDDRVSAFTALINLSALDSLQAEDMMPDLRIQIFSDSVILALPLRAKAIIDMLFITNTASWRLMRHGVWLRGGITIGHAYFDDFAAFGPAIIEAYDIESTLAKQPRIALGKPALDAFRKEEEHLQKARFAERDSDGIYFPNFLNFAADIMLRSSKDHAAIFRADAENIKVSIEKKIAETVSNPSVFGKVMWVTEKWNKAFSVHESLSHLFINVD
ncbi:MAG: hypothetical protein ABJL57_00940 [Hyphomonas sp.]|uniref:hypothetical protein n=1 Tax=Hyphomonas sp. TaxID=87 RepID=UPI0032672A71